MIRSTILPPENTTVDFTQGVGLPALSPDGRRIVFGARTADGKTPLWVRSLDGLTAQPLAGTEGATFPFWSPDSRFIAFFADGKLKKIDASGGPALTLTDAPARARRKLEPRRRHRICAEQRRRAAPAGLLGRRRFQPRIHGTGKLPWFLPDGQHFLYQESGRQRRGISDSSRIPGWFAEQGGRKRAPMPSTLKVTCCFCAKAR